MSANLTARLLALAALALSVASCQGQAEFPADKVAQMVEFTEGNSLVGDETWADGRTLRCDPVSKQICHRDGCRAGEVSVWSNIRPSVGDYQRCEAAGCSDYEAVVSHSGLWTTLSLPENNALLRLSSSGKYVEVLTQGEDIYIYHGQCR